MDPLDYPFEIPDASYLLEGGVARPLAGFDPDRARAERRTPVLAVGSNASPRQLARKFAGRCDTPLPVTRVRVRDLTPVYSAHIATRGYVPATPWREPGVTTTTFVNWLAPEQLTIMHVTESRGRNYDFARLHGIHCDLDGAPIPDLHAYLSRHGCLARDGAPIALAALAPRESALRRMDQRQLFDWLRQLLSPDEALDRFVRSSLDGAVREARIDTLRAHALALAPSHAVIR